MFSDHLFILLLLAPVLALIITVRTLTKVVSQPGQNHPPGPYSWPVLGNLAHMLKGPHVYFTELARSYGPLCSVKLGTHLFVIGSSPMAATEIMKAHDRLPTYRWVPKAGQDGLQDYSLIWATECTDHWKLLRSLCRTELFSAKGLDSQSILREKNVDKMVEFLNNKQGKVVNIREVAFATTVNILGNICFSEDFVGLEGDEKESRGLKRALYRLMKLGTTPNVADFYPIFEGLDPQGLKKKTSEVMNEAFSVWGHVIKERRVKREYQKGSDLDERDFLDTMLRCGFSDLQINQLAVELFSGGTHSTASTIEWALAELIKNKEAMFMLRNELDKEIGSTTCIKESQVSQLPYLHACVKETLRLHPPAPLLHPQAILEGSKIMNYNVPKNSQLIINVWAMGRDPSLWEDPVSFKPERFCDSSVDFKGQDFKFLPFGVGRRMCPGYPYAIKQIHLMLASLVRNFDWFLPNNMEDLSKLDMTENFGIISQRKKPLMVIPKCKC
ncbi:putative N-methylcoclaurine 3'-monooxygenase [Helianthus annuus]|uniref:Putative cytochrome P450 n=1 Tax=Helianthus annuus TaxID=4232 RepID=A0A251SQU9_HELAN|nr:probable (S)-N-methylcoclaurine 3'-hydroxylase isozyme 2 [Helianthus annuus]KAJ0476001.1 putative N-methylcoclaurine 3'-monooxygenase [Helianthus annuus]KAJ0480051.1 putative N-methylcoclaurine 3'-monooxygenase [Helianthus annuus]KAJ0496806.1 putative N-methylcoclaurine 3'-monooxygenase [Helianthus annuus]KAJ0662839.1 putative N-methylcoclaurine 3'-monooxygenase [Helianthus annuus]KAJ0670354.1 putative N-methylcoclaurine 3'-monooxygenase [Helianthus annuus]